MNLVVTWLRLDIDNVRCVALGGQQQQQQQPQQQQQQQPTRPAGTATQTARLLRRTLQQAVPLSSMVEQAADAQFTYSVGECAAQGQTLATHTWTPTADAATWRGVVVVFHGYAAHGAYPTVRFGGELVAGRGNFVCMSVDFPGHGGSPGLTVSSQTTRTSRAAGRNSSSTCRPRTRSCAAS